MRVKAILEWLKSELERNYEFKRSSLTHKGPGILGFCNNFVFESEQIAVDIMYFNTGIIYMGAVDQVTDEMFIDVSFVPDDYSTKDYPKESEEILVQKVNELLNYLHNKNPNLKVSLPSDF